MKLLYLFITTLVSAVHCNIDLTYNDKIAYTEDGLQCVNNCVNGKCIVNDSLELQNCTKTDKDAPVHRTIHDSICLSRCFEDPVYTGKCYTDQERNWDYCESSTTVVWIRDRVYTDNSGPCRDACRSNSGRGPHRCNNYWKGSDSCDPQWGANYIQARTIKGDLCKGMCKAHLGKSYTWCAYGMRDEEACALPGLPRPRDWSQEIKELLAIKEPMCIRILNPNPGKCRSSLNDEENSHKMLLEKYAQDLENNPNFTTVLLHNNAIPVFSYTIQEGSINVPKVVRATIRPRDLFNYDEYHPLPHKVKENLNKMEKRRYDRVGYLVGYLMGGPDEQYNLFNQNCNTYHYDKDKKIEKFLDQNRHHLDTKVELLAVALYHDGETRVKGIARHIKFYHSNNLMEEIYEYIPNSDDSVSKSPVPFGETSLLPLIDLTQSNRDGECYTYFSSDPLAFTEKPQFDINPQFGYQESYQQESNHL